MLDSLTFDPVPSPPAAISLPGVTIHVGDALERLRAMADESVHCAVTSPPYYSLRDYNCDGQIGLEKTPGLYVARLVEVFRELRRVLRRDGTFWLVIGDSYANGGRTYRDADAKSPVREMSTRPRDGAKPKDLLMIPARVALAIQADGWWLRSHIVWAKGNAMPESVRDRPTSSHESVFLFAKSERYFYDAEAVKEPLSPASLERAKYPRVGHPKDVYGDGFTNLRNPATDAASRAREIESGTRNCRNVWNLNTRGFNGAHFAVFPEALAERCIKAGTSEAGCCPRCGAPLVRVMGDRVPVEGRGAGNGFVRPVRQTYLDANGPRGDDTPWTPTARQTVGWSQSCRCDPAPPVPCTVLDPFGGAGTTAVAAHRLGRDAVLVEINPEYAELAASRLRAMPGKP